MRSFLERNLNSLPWWLALPIAVAVLIAVWVFRVNLSATHFPGFWGTDPFTYFYPMYSALHQSPDWGSVIWNPHDGFGVPALGMLQGGYLYPPHALYYWLPTAQAMQAMAVAHMIMATWFTALWCRAIGLGWFPGVVGGLSFTLTYGFSKFSSPPFLEVAVWIPLGLYAIERYVREGRAKSLCWLSISIAMLFLAGGSQTAVYGLLCLGLYTLLALSCFATAHDKMVAAWSVLLALALGLSLAAPQLLTAMETSQLSARSMENLTAAKLLPFGPMFPDAMSLLERLVFAPNGPIEGYVGAVLLTLCMLALTARHRRIVVFGITGIVIGIISLLSPPWLVDLLAETPVLSWFRFPSRLVVMLHVGAAVLAALGTNSLLAACRSPLSGPRAAQLLIVVVGSCALGWLRYPAVLWWVPVTFAVFVTGAGLLRLEKSLGLALLLLVVVDLAGVTRNETAMPWAKDSPSRSAELRELSEQLGLARVMPVGVGREGPASGWHAKVGTESGFYTPLNYDPLTPKLAGDFLRYAAVREVLNTDEHIPFTGKLNAEEEITLLRHGRHYLASMNVRYYLFKSTAYKGMIAQLERSGLHKVGINSDTLDDFVVLEDASAMPRAYGVYDVRCAHNAADGLAQLGALSLGTAVILEGQHCIEQYPEDELPRPVVRIDNYQAARVDLKVAFDAPGYVLLADAYYPGWVARVDGQEVAIQKANMLARAVAVPAGEHHVQFKYQPASFRYGVFIALSGFLILMLLLRKAIIADAKPPHTTS